MLWKDPVTQRKIAYFTYLENDSTPGPTAAYIEDSTGDGQQDSDPTTNGI